MARGSKAKYTSKQKRMAEHIEEGYEKKGVPEETAEGRAWATVNKLTGGGMKGGSGSKAKAARLRPVARKNARKAGAKGGKARAAATRASTRKPTRTQRAGIKVTARKTAGRRVTAKRGATSSRAKSATKSATKPAAKRGGSLKSPRGRSSARKGTGRGTRK